VGFHVIYAGAGDHVIAILILPDAALLAEIPQREHQVLAGSDIMDSNSRIERPGSSGFPRRRLYSRHRMPIRRFCSPSTPTVNSFIFEQADWLGVALVVDFVVRESQIGVRQYVVRLVEKENLSTSPVSELSG